MEEVNLKDLLDTLCNNIGWSVCANNAEYYETFVECSDVVWMSNPDHHRWYTMYDVVRSLTVDGVDYCFADKRMSVDGDNSAEDCGWEDPNVEDIVQVFPKEVLTTVYVTKDKL